MPVDGSLMCNFNQVFKLDPVMFDLWLNITASSPHSSLVLLRYPPEAERYLRATMRLKVSGLLALVCSAEVFVLTRCDRGCGRNSCGY